MDLYRTDGMNVCGAVRRWWIQGKHSTYPYQVVELDTLILEKVNDEKDVKEEWNLKSGS